MVLVHTDHLAKVFESLGHEVTGVIGVESLWSAKSLAPRVIESGDDGCAGDIRQWSIHAKVCGVITHYQYVFVAFWSLC
jgi:hypothetical protein